jgi:prophage regulatory protein
MSELGLLSRTADVMQRIPQEPPVSCTEVFLSLAQVRTLINVSRSTIYRWMQAGRFPRPLIISSQMRRWERADLDRWIASRRAATESTRGRRPDE